MKVSDLIFILLISVLLVYCQVPVFIWEPYRLKKGHPIKPMPLKLNSEDFINHMSRKVKNKSVLLVLFWTHFLSTEDFIMRDENGHRPFSHLKEKLKSTKAKTEFLPSVEFPIDSLKKFSRYNRVPWVNMNSTDFPEVSEEELLEIKLSQLQPFTQRYKVLRKYDHQIVNLYSFLIKKKMRLLCLLTAKFSPWTDLKDVRFGSDLRFPSFVIDAMRDKIITSSEPPSLYFNNVKIWNAEQPDEVFLHFGIYNTRATIYFNDGDKRFHFRFIQDNDKWKLDRMSLFMAPNDEKIEMFPESPISGMEGSPYYSDTAVTFTSPNKSFNYIFKDLNVSGKAKNNTKEGNHIVTPGILMTYLVMVLILIFFVYGIAMLMAIRTMDRFDDPKGKPLPIITN